MSKRSSLLLADSPTKPKGERRLKTMETIVVILFLILGILYFIKK